MSKAPRTSSTASPAPDPAATDAAAAFADAHVVPTEPLMVDAVADSYALAAAQPDALRRAELATLAEPAPIVDERPGYLLIVCGRPGFRRAGLTHAARAEYPLDFFTVAQLAQIRAEPMLELVEVGGVAVPRLGVAFGTPDPAPVRRDPRAAGRAAETAISDPPNRSEPGMRNALAGASHRI